ncbi:MAG: hypothetical protein ACTSQX_16375 [Candidatus Heimdallarchaeota archaeon]
MAVEGLTFDPEKVLVGFTGRRFHDLYGPYVQQLVIGDPSSYQSGTGMFLDYLCHFNYFAPNEILTTSLLPKIETYTSRIKQILAINESMNNIPLACSNVLQIFEMLGRLDEINVIPLVECIKSKQLHDGGWYAYRSYPDYNYSGIFNTRKAVDGLLAVNEEPDNLTALQDFVYSLQRPNHTFEIQKYEFVMDNISNELGGTADAISILNNYNLEVPYKAQLIDKFDSYYADVIANYSTYSWQEKYDKISACVWKSWFLEDLAKIPELKNRLWELNNQLNETDKYLMNNDKPYAPSFAKNLAKAGKAAFHMNYYVSPYSFTRTSKDQNFTVRLDNISPFKYNITVKELTINNTQVKLMTNITGSYTIQPFTQLDLPIYLSRNESEQLPEDLTNLTLNLRLEGNMRGTMNGHTKERVEGEVYFAIPLVEESPDKKTPAWVVGTLIAVPTAIGIGTTYGIIKKRKKKSIL